MSRKLYMTSILELLYRISQTNVGRKSKVLLTRSLPGGLGGRSPPMCRPPSILVMDEVKQREPKSCFILAENFNPTSLWVGSHRYTRIFQLSKPLWANNAHKVEPNTRPIKNNSKSLLILKSPKTNLKLPSLIAKSSPYFSILQYCWATGGCYWT